MSGVPLTTNPPFGYMKNPENIKEWIVDEPAAKVVRRIFNLCIEGLGPSQIATRLKELTPEIVHEFIEKIVVSKPTYIDGTRQQSIDIYYKGVGIIKFFSAEEMETLYQKHINSKRSKEKTA